eukprot:CAMPEP_0195282456 /NCGR_PEP_ID=MMETSP0707-20130614/1315_1 /TAXON_ID=33640 /ORGANISM="Asterionellopsis glacialis, Strain CCMP134" /LENGTH=377 /DNA_ID=CAMNT_0040341423 /DNA_START=387 /DNA_END=1520 /DNA_ORIENTATION=-
MPKFKYSTRKGLKIVDQVARELLDTLDSSDASLADTTTTGGDIVEDRDSSVMSYSDLVQEGIVALMHAMANFNPPASKDEKDQPSQHQEDTVGEAKFESFARNAIYNSMSRCLADDSRPIRLPGHVQTVLQNARQERLKLENEFPGRTIANQEVATNIGIDVEKLELYLLVSRDTLSTERTVEVFNTWLDNDSAPFREDMDGDTASGANQNTHNIKEGSNMNTMLGGSSGVTTDEDEYYLYEEEGEDEMWVHQEQIAGPLGDFIADTSASPDDVALASMIQHDVDDFLTRTLNEQECEVIRMRYGLTGGQSSSDVEDDSSSTPAAMSLTHVAKHLGVSRTRIAQIEERALEKLRTSYTNRYVEVYLDDEHESITDTV